MIFGKYSYLNKTRKHIKKHGWQLTLIPGDEKGPGFCYTIGLWETYQHPELILFAPKADPSGFAFAINALVARIQKGETVVAGSREKNLFGEFNGTIRSVLPEYFSTYLGTAATYYKNFDFQALQIFWPDKDGLFPWQDGFQDSFLRAQPNLWQSNVILAGMGSEYLDLFRKEEPQHYQQSFDRLFVELMYENQKPDLEQSLQTIIGQPVSILRITLFGDVIYRQSDGAIGWFDSSSGEWDTLPAEQGPWEAFISNFPRVFFHQGLFLTLIDIDMTLEPGQVYSQITPGYLGGEESLNNLGFVDAFVHIGHTCRTLQALESS